jgi:hypothetical protein
VLLQYTVSADVSAAVALLLFGRCNSNRHARCLHPTRPALPHTACLPARHCLAPGEQVGVNLGQPGYMEAIAKQTADIDIQVVFCNAGYVLTGFFADV